MQANIIDLKGKIKSLTRRVFLNHELFPALLILVVGVLSFGLGRLSVYSTVAVPQRYVSSMQGAQASVSQSSQPGKNAEETKMKTATTSVAKAQAGEKKYVASKNGTKYHLPWCSGAAHIAEKNKVWFASKEAAAAAGYTPASNCKGI